MRGLVNANRRTLKSYQKNFALGVVFDIEKHVRRKLVSDISLATDLSGTL